MKIVERLIDQLPIPLLVAAGVVLGIAWGTKQLRSLPDWGAVLRSTTFQIPSFLVVLVLLDFYGIGLILKYQVPGMPFEETVYVAQIEGDNAGVVQRHTIESLQTAFVESDQNSPVRVRPLKRKLDFDEANSSGSLSRFCVVYGTYIPPSTIHYKFLAAGDPLERRVTIPEYPDIARLTKPVVSAVAQIGSHSSQSLGAQGRISELLLENERLRASLEQARSELQEQPPVVPNSEVEAIQTKVASFYLKKKRHVILIGVNDYSRMGSLANAVRDVYLLRETLGDLPMQSGKVTTLLNEEASKARILEELERLAQVAEAEDQVVIYFSGHGVTKDGIGYLVPADADPNRLETTAVSMLDIGRLFGRIEATQKLMLVDSCYAGAFGISSRGIQRIERLEGLMLGAGQVVITAGTDSQLVSDDNGLGHGVFTYHLAEVLKGEADTDNDGLVTVMELFSFVRTRVEAQAGIGGFVQTPAMHANGLTDFVISVLPAAANE